MTTVLQVVIPSPSTMLIIPIIFLAVWADPLPPIALPSCPKTDYLGRWEFQFDICDPSAPTEVMEVDLKEGKEAVEVGNRRSGNWEWTQEGVTLNILDKMFSEDPLGGVCGHTMAGSVRLSSNSVLSCFSATKQ